MSTLLAIAVAACSEVVYQSWDVTIDNAVEVPDGSQVLMVRSQSDAIEDGNVVTEVDVSEDERRATTKPTSIATGSSVYIFAFLDLDGSGAWEAGEPWGEDADNPVKMDGDHDSVFTIGPDVE